MRPCHPYMDTEKFCNILSQHVEFLPPDEEPLHLELESDHGGLDRWVEDGRGVVVSSDGATDGDPAVHVHVHHHRL